jgi:hypothetical protein
MPQPVKWTLAQIAKQGGPTYPNVTPYTHITATMVVWQDADRVRKLLEHIRPFFSMIRVCVQSSSDNTLEVARALADDVVTDEHLGYGDASYGPRVLSRVTSRWSLKLDADEWPTLPLLRSLSSATWMAEQDPNTMDGVWIPFRSSVDGIEYEEQHGHLRLFQTWLGWPAKLHSRPMTSKTLYWHTGHIRHDRSLDEMMRDYLSYWSVGQGNQGWEAHNKLMMYHACTGTAAVKGWEYVKSFEWWPRVEAIAFKENQPWL